MPERIQLRRTKGWRKPADAVVVARPSRWGNPFRDAGAKRVTPEVRAEVVRRYRIWLEATYEGRLLAIEVRHHLAGRDLACWCPLDEPCHADVLLEIANPPTGHKPL